MNLGCGLAHYFQWLDNGQARMTDADLPEVLSIRRALLPTEGDRHVLHEADLTGAGWRDRLGLPATQYEQPVFLFSEGVLMYLLLEVVRAVLRTFGERAGRLHLRFRCHVLARRRPCRAASFGAAHGGPIPLGPTASAGTDDAIASPAAGGGTTGDGGLRLTV